MPIYMQYGPKGKIAGSVTEAGHAGWVLLNSFNWGVGRGIGSPTGASANREASAPSVSEITVSKLMDKSSFALLQEALKGTGMDCTIHFTVTDAGKMRTYAEYKLSNSLISGYSVSSGGDRPTETSVDQLHEDRVLVRRTGHRQCQLRHAACLLRPVRGRDRLTV